MDNKKDHSRIVKNSLFLYFRMILTLVVTLYTSRVVLNVLGVEDFGIYNVIGGVVTMMAFLSGAMSSATQRFLSFELGKGDVNQYSNVFKMSINIHLLIILIVVLLAETIGLWFINNKLVIPVERLAAANLIFHYALFSFCCTIMSVPYNAAIISHEKMKAFAYISIIDVILKLLVAFLLVRISNDKLESYGFMLAVVSFITCFCYYLYSRSHFPETKFGVYWDKGLFLTLFGYTGWNLFGNLSSVATNQGINIVLNIFFGAIVNAARAIAFQVNAAIFGFISSLLMSINPQIIKSYAKNDVSYMHELIFAGARYTFFLLLLLSLPVIFETQSILGLWLGEAPEYADLFIKLVLVESCIMCFSGTLMTAAQATGKIKLYQTIVGGLQLCNIPLSIAFLKIYSSPFIVCYISISISILALILRLIFLKLLIGLSISDFYSNVIYPSVKAVVGSLIFVRLSFYGIEYFSLDFIYVLFLKIMTSLVITSLVIVFLCLNKTESAFLFSFLKRKLGMKGYE